MSGRPQLPREPRAGAPVDANWGAQVVRYLRSLTPQPTPSVRVNHGSTGTTFTAAHGARPTPAAGRVLVMEFECAGAVPTPAEMIEALEQLYDPAESPLDPVPTPAEGDIVNLFTVEGEDEVKVLRFRARVTRSDPQGTEEVALDFTHGDEPNDVTWHAMLTPSRVPFVWQTEYEQADATRARPTVGELVAALEEFYVGARLPEEGDVVSLAHDGQTRYRAWIVAHDPGLVGTLSTLSFEVNGKEWFALVDDISGELHFENDDVAIDVDAAGIRVTSKGNIDPESGSPAVLHIDPIDLERDMIVRELDVLDWDEVKSAYVLASEPQPLDDPRHVVLGLEAGAHVEIEETEEPGVWRITGEAGASSVIAGGGIDVVTLETGQRLIRAAPTYGEGNAIKIEFEAAGTDLDGTPLLTAFFNCLYRVQETSLIRTVTSLDDGYIDLELKIEDKPGSAVRLYTDDEGDSFYFDLANQHPFRVTNASSDETAKVRVTFGTVNDVIPTMGSTSGDPLDADPAPTLEVVTGVVYLELTLYATDGVDYSKGDVQYVVVKNAAAMPTYSAATPRRLLATITVIDGNVTAINQSVTGSLGFQVCAGSHNFWQ